MVTLKAVSIAKALIEAGYVVELSQDTLSRVTLKSGEPLPMPPWREQRESSNGEFLSGKLPESHPLLSCGMN